VTRTFYIVDGHSHLFRAYHAVGYLSTSRGLPSHAVLILSTMLWKLVREEQPDYLGIAWDAPGPTFRDALFTDYKATRTRMPDDLVRQLPYVKRLFEALHTPVVEVSGYEADDVLATLVRNTLAHEGVDVVIVTGDKDLLQLVGPRVRVLSVLGRTGERVVYDEAKVRERWGVEPVQIADVLALMGDSIDNIPGVRGVGEKTAVKLVTQFGGVERLYENLTLVGGKLRETLATGRKDALLSRELAVLNRDVPLAFDLEAFRRVEPDWVKLRALWMEMEFARLLKELPAITVASTAEPVEPLADEAAVGAWLARVPAGAPIAVDWAGDARPPEPRIAALALFHPAAGAAALLPEAAAPLVASGRELVIHDAKPMVQWWLAHGFAAPRIEDSAVAAYLLNPARATYRLDEICMEAFGECPPALPGPAASGAGRGSLARYDTRREPLPAPDADVRAGAGGTDASGGITRREPLPAPDADVRVGAGGTDASGGITRREPLPAPDADVRVGAGDTHASGDITRRDPLPAADADVRVGAGDIDASRGDEAVLAPDADSATDDSAGIDTTGSPGDTSVPAAASGPDAPADGGGEIGRVLGTRARWLWRFWKHAAAELDERGLRSVYDDMERPLVEVLAVMERHGVRVEPGRLEAFAKELERTLDNLTREIYALAGGPFTIASPKQLGQVLFEKLKLPAIRKTKTGYSTDADVLTELAPRHELPAKVLEHRALAKLKGTYADALPLLVNPVTGRIHTTFNQLVAATGRLSSQDPNLMNIPIRTELGRRIRAAFVPAEGWRFVAADYSQIELRILAHMSGEEAIIESFQRGEDIHTRTACEVFKVAPAEVTSLQRTIAKSANYAILYGVSAFGLSQATRIDQKEAQRYIQEYFRTHPKVREFIDRTLAEGRERGWVTTLLGRRRYLPDLRSQNPVARNAAERMAMNAPVQGTASDMIKIAMVRLHAALAARGLRARMLLQVHDELLFEAPPDEVQAVEALARDVMESALPLRVPVVVDVKSGKDWAEV
jgi:DNA polymerase-1